PHGGPPAVAFDRGGDGLDLREAAGVWVLGMRLQVRNRDVLIVGALDGHADLEFMPNPERRQRSLGRSRRSVTPSLFDASSKTNGSRSPAICPVASRTQ